MDLLVLLNHFINFAAPAAWLALLLPWLARLLIRKRSPGFSLLKQGTIIFMAGLLVLLLGLTLLGQDGKMVTYLTLVITAATSQRFMLKGWRG
ncbi:MAG: hypothetical protein CO105_05930 [Comamonadaceae bacterium CG_4_9_14_3_um_filter_60_33]|nr:MAG: hypothetical protein AUK51_03135 [Comamonadaceae bacterium CG2_30_59_20]PIY28123.1 MAG: hypothetical protein COZ09_11590 [Comamonadaceae bacterium CG_4_10_14_3_um_filter_60_42]PJB44591.1 MAG: hypothetical protein CO105_05930 [Comamonadaceae bacterium CG_4_9_14_3_um_filter_60_33]